MTSRVSRVILFLAALALGGCRNAPSVALIEFIDQGGRASVRSVLDVVLDSLDRDAKIAIRLAPLRAETAKDELDRIRLVYRALEAVRSPEVVAAVGMPGSSEVMTTGPVYRDAGIPLVVPTANAPQLASLGPGVFLMAPRMDEEARFISDFVAGRLGAHTATVVYNPGAWGGALQAQLSVELWQRGVQVLGPLPVATIRCSDSGPMLAKYVTAALELGRPDVVVLADYAQCLIDEFERQAPGLTFVSGDGLVMPDDVVQRRAQLDGRVYAVAFESPAARAGPAATAFRRLFEELNGSTPTWVDAAMFDAVMSVVATIREVGADRRAIARQLYALGRTRPPHAGITGPIVFMETRSERLTMESPTSRARPAP